MNTNMLEKQAQLKLEQEMTQETVSENKTLKVVKIILKVFALLVCLYSFIVSLDLMSSSFRLIGGKYASEAFKSNVILTNPVAGLVIGVIVTVVVQSSSTSTSIIVSMVSSGILQVKYAIPIIMGANIGTSVTSVLVSLTQVGDKENFQRAFAGATVHDSFNLLSVLVLLPIEVMTGYLEHTTQLLVESFTRSGSGSSKEPELLTALTKPFTNSIIQLDKKVLEAIAQNTSKPNDTLIKHFCPKNVTNNNTLYDTENRCSFLLEPLNWPEWGVGLLLLVVSLIVLCTCLIVMVKILSSIFNGPVAKIIQKVVNSDLPGKWRYFTAPMAMMLGCILTIIVQSSSVFTSSLVPLVGLGLVSIERLFPLTLGANIGTTVTGILASLSSSSNTLKYSLQIALCHTLFNISGILIWYPLPFLRKVPLDIARFLGRKSAEYRWFAVLYIVLTFILIPLFIFCISLLGLTVFLCVMIPIIAVIVFVLVLNYLQARVPFTIDLPKVLKTWDFLPLPLRSLEPYDKVLSKFCCKCLNKQAKVVPEEHNMNDLNEVIVKEPVMQF